MRYVSFQDDESDEEYRKLKQQLEDMDRRRAEKEQKKKVEEARRRAESEERKLREEARRKAESEEKKKRDEARRRAESEERRKKEREAEYQRKREEMLRKLEELDASHRRPQSPSPKRAGKEVNRCLDKECTEMKEGVVYGKWSQGLAKQAVI